MARPEALITRPRGSTDSSPAAPPQAVSDHTFTLRLLAPGWSLDDLSVHLYERIDDVSLMGPDDDGTFLLEVDRQARCLPDALVTALSELMSVLPDATVLRVDEYDLATMADIARRSGRTPESIRLLVGGKRGPGGFPPAAGRVDARTKIWRWADVGTWFEATLGEPLPDTSDSAFLAGLQRRPGDPPAHRRARQTSTPSYRRRPTQGAPGRLS
jgi:hypothetical protein